MHYARLVLAALTLAFGLWFAWGAYGLASHLNQRMEAMTNGTR